MKKIKKFKINIRKNCLISNFKTAYDTKDIKPEILDVIDKEISKAKDYLEPQVLFETFQLHTLKGKLDIVFQQDEKIIACTLIILTIGDKIENETSIAQKKVKIYI